MIRPLHIAVLGAIGAVGREMLRVLEQRSFPTVRVIALASARSAGQTRTVYGVLLVVSAGREEAVGGVDGALFRAGGGTSRDWAERAVARGAGGIDNSSVWRMDPAVPLVVPEVNMGAAADRLKGII